MYFHTFQQVNPDLNLTLLSSVQLITWCKIEWFGNFWILNDQLHFRQWKPDVLVMYRDASIVMHSDAQTKSTC